MVSHVSLTSPGNTPAQPHNTGVALSACACSLGHPPPPVLHTKTLRPGGVKSPSRCRAGLSPQLAALLCGEEWGFRRSGCRHPQLEAVWRTHTAVPIQPGSSSYRDRQAGPLNPGLPSVRRVSPGRQSRKQAFAVPRELSHPAASCHCAISLPCPLPT